jgi:hypothetical protein
MPFYAFKCPHCECRFERLLKIADRDIESGMPRVRERLDPSGRSTHDDGPRARRGHEGSLLASRKCCSKIHEKTPGSRLNESANF